MMAHPICPQGASIIDSGKVICWQHVGPDDRSGHGRSFMKLSRVIVSQVGSSGVYFMSSGQPESRTYWALTFLVSLVAQVAILSSSHLTPRRVRTQRCRTWRGLASSHRIAFFKRIIAVNIREWTAKKPCRVRVPNLPPGQEIRICRAR